MSNKKDKTDNQIQDIIKDINKTCGLDAVAIKSRDLKIGEDFLDTGSASLNSILSGSTKGGIPKGTITGLYGPSGCGKSFIIAKTIISAQKEGYIAIVVDTEATWDDTAQSFGVDVSKCILIQEDIIENIRKGLVNIINNNSEKLKSGELKFIIILDSIGGLQSQKEVDDALNGHNAMDMGTRARVLKTLFKSMTTNCKRHNIPFIWANHCYDDPSQFYPSAIQKMPGGKAPWFFSSDIIMMRRKEVKDVEGSGIFRNKGVIIPIECVKNRNSRPFLTTEMYIDYATGIERYHGLFEIAQEFGVIHGTRTYTLEDGTKLGYKKDFIYNEKVWEEKILPILNPLMETKFKYGSSETAKILENIDIDE